MLRHLLDGETVTLIPLVPRRVLQPHRGYGRERS
jgi:hypothetical protein